MASTNLGSFSYADEIPTESSDGITELRFTTRPSFFDMIFCEITITSPSSIEVLDDDRINATISSFGWMSSFIFTGIM